jgi:hypothetical protein
MSTDASAADPGSGRPITADVRLGLGSQDVERRSLPGGRLRGVPLALALAGVLLAVAAACDSGGGDRSTLPTSRPSAEQPTDRSPTKKPESTSRTATLPTRSTGNEEAGATTRTATTAAAATSTAARTTATTRAEEATTSTTRAEEATTSTTRATPATTSAVPPTTLPAAAQPSPAAATSGGSGTLGWLLLLVLALGALVAFLFVRRSRRGTTWDAEASAATADTRAVLDRRLPTVMTAQAAAERALTWPPLREDLIGLANRWGNLSGHAPDDPRRESAGQLVVTLQDLVAALDAESQALATGRQWQLLRPQVDAVIRALLAALAAQPAPFPPAGEPGAAAYP